MCGGTYRFKINMPHNKFFPATIRRQMHTKHCFVFSRHINTVDFRHSTFFDCQSFFHAGHGPVIRFVFCQNTWLIKVFHTKHVMIFTNVIRLHAFRRTILFYCTQGIFQTALLLPASSPSCGRHSPHKPDWYTPLVLHHQLLLQKCAIPLHNHQIQILPLHFSMPQKSLSVIVAFS